jgi:hypothetical protein
MSCRGWLTSGLSLMCSAFRLAAAGTDPLASFLLPDVAALIEQHWPGLRMPRLLRRYSVFRTANMSLTDLGGMALDVPAAVDELRDTISTAAFWKQSTRVTTSCCSTAGRSR